MSNTMTQNPYITRFQNMLKPLQSKLSKLEIKLDSIDNNHPDKQQSTLNVLEEISKTKQEIENIEKNLEYSKTIPIIRSEKVPHDIPDHNVWNDCWYDKERELYVTHNKYFMEIPDAGDRPHQIQYTKETGDYGVVVLDDKVEFRFGYPAILLPDSKGRDVWFLLPTMTNDMLVEELVVSRLKPKSVKDAILYETESEQWITVGKDRISMCEKENEISDKLELFPPVPLEELKTLYGRK